MTTVTKNVEILTTLNENPYVSFFPWEMDIHDVAAGMAKSIHPLGLLSAILTDEQWNTYPGNSTMDQNGQIQLLARYQPPNYVNINDTMTSVELYVSKANNDKLQLWIDSGEALKTAIIKSLGKNVRQVIRDKKVRFQRLTSREIIDRVKARYGQMDKDVKAELKEKMLTMLPTADGLDIHISNLQDMFEISENAGYPEDEFCKVEIFRETTCTHPLICEVLKTFDLLNPNSKIVTFDQISAYLTLHLPNLKHAQMMATRATANMVAANAYTTLEVESKRLKLELDNLKRKRPPQQ